MFIAAILVCVTMESPSCTVFANSEELFPTRDACVEELNTLPVEAFPFSKRICIPIPGEPV